MRKRCFGAFTDDLSGFNISAFASPSALHKWALAGMEFDKFATPRPVEDRGGDLAEERRCWRGSMVCRESEPPTDAVAGQVQGMAGQHGGIGKYLLHTQTLH